VAASKTEPLRPRPRQAERMSGLASPCTCRSLTVCPHGGRKPDLRMMAGESTIKDIR
jgi:hypothetical protein